MQIKLADVCDITEQQTNRRYVSNNFLTQNVILFFLSSVNVKQFLAPAL